ncbi:transglutaminase family protein [uncultured Maribacter sp.]|uniref:transglutaminase-like domain-containing protein n=1 Tax=uncultured Maribacter sp. TaxID=431308 RepID=UPI0030EB7F00|tara:strand:+ start:8202 stop:9641 length:1440 start_codon:yes stop_codon:yes gene_type:complete
MPRWYFLDGYKISVEKSEFTLNLPSAMKYRFKDNNLDAFEVQRAANENGLKYNATNLKAIESEDFDPEFRDFAPNVQLALEDFHLKGVDGHATTWKEFGSWIYNSLLKERGELNVSTIEKIKRLVIDTEDPKEKIRRVYQFVQDNTRYISVQMGIGGWEPISANEVDRVKYGDCKGLTNYTMALLKAVGIDSYYTIVSADASMQSLDYDFPSLQGNHAFLNVPVDGEEIWLECTSQVVPANFLGTFTDDRYVLKVGPNGGQMVKSKKYLPEQSMQKTKAKITINKSEINVQVEIKSTGIQYNQKYGLANDSREDVEKYYKHYWDYVNDIHILNHEIINDKDSIVTVENVEFKTSGYLSKAGDRILFSPNMLNRNEYVPKKEKDRNRDIVIKRGYLDEDDFIIELPKGYKVEANLKATKLNNEFGEFEVSIEQLSESKLHYKRRLLIQSGVFSNTVYDDYRNFRKEISRIDKNKIVLLKK